MLGVAFGRVNSALPLGELLADGPRNDAEPTAITTSLPGV